MSRISVTDNLRLKATTSLSMFATAIGVAWALVGLWMGNWFMIACGSALSLLSLASSLVTHLVHASTGRLVWFLGAVLLVQFVHLSLPRSAHIDQLYACIMGAAFLNFSFTRDRVPLMITLVWIILNLFAGIALGAGRLAPSLGGYPVAEELVLSVVSPFTTATNVIAVAVSVAVFSALAERYYTALRAAQASAEAANKAKSMFLASMSHEIRTPMNGVLGMADILAASELPPTAQRNVAIVRESAQSLLRIIDDILDMSSIEAGKLRVISEPFDLVCALESAMESMRGYADQCNVLCHFQISNDVPLRTDGDAGRLRQIVLNLMGNAIKFSRRPPDEAPGYASLVVDMDPQGRLRLIFRDDGVGIAPDLLPELFRPFVRAEAVTTRRFGGTGLGLAIVHELVGKMNGQITAQSVQGEGATFTVILPLLGATTTEPPLDMRGDRILLCGLTPPQISVWKGLLLGSGAEIVVLDDAAGPDIIARSIGGGEDHAIAVFTAFGTDGKPAPSAQEAVRARLPGLRMIVHTRIRNMASRLQDTRTFMLQSAPTIRSDAIGALRALGVGVRGALPRPATPDAPISTKPEPTGHASRILLAEDNEINQLVLAAQLRKLGHEPTIAANGREALALWQGGNFDLVLTDCHMPEMDGFELAAAIRSEERARNLSTIPIIAITANAQAEQRDQCLAVGMTGILTKPVGFPELSTLLEMHVRRTS